MMGSRLFTGCIFFCLQDPGPRIKINTISAGLNPFITLKCQSIDRHSEQ